jgi:hypothetical protein
VLKQQVASLTSILPDLSTSKTVASPLAHTHQA